MLLQHQLKLVEGKFTPDEARNVLFDLIGSKIKFHSAGSFSSLVRAINDDTNHVRRLSELREARDRMASIVSYASENGLKLELSGTIFIRLAP